MSPAASEDGQRDLIGAWLRGPERVLSAGDPSNASEGGIEGDRNRRRRAQPDAHRRGGRRPDRRAARRAARSAARTAGHAQLLGWARELGEERVWAIEDCRHLSGGLERLLLEAGERVLRVPPKLMASERKTVALVRQVRRDRRARGRARGDARTGPARGARWPGRARAAAARRSSRGARPGRHALSAAAALASARDRPRRWRRPRAAPAKTQQPRPARPPAGADAADRAGADLPRADPPHPRARQARRRARPRARRLVAAQHPALLEIPGCGVITAARILAEVGGIERFATEARLASYAGVAPLDASSGRQQRHRLNRAGNRQLNRALYTIALTQIRIHPPARDYIARRIERRQDPPRSAARAQTPAHPHASTASSRGSRAPPRFEKSSPPT